MSDKGKLCAITGPTSGIGEATALGLAERGFDLLLLCRNIDKGEELDASAFCHQFPALRRSLKRQIEVAAGVAFIP